MLTKVNICGTSNCGTQRAALKSIKAEVSFCSFSQSSIPVGCHRLAALLRLLVINFSHLANGFDAFESQRVLLRVLNAIKDQSKIVAMGKPLRRLSANTFPFHSLPTNPPAHSPSSICLCFLWFEFLMQLLIVLRIFTQVIWFCELNLFHLALKYVCIPRTLYRLSIYAPVSQSISQPASQSVCLSVSLLRCWLCLFSFSRETQVAKHYFVQEIQLKLCGFLLAPPQINIKWFPIKARRIRTASRWRGGDGNERAKMAGEFGSKAQNKCINCVWMKSYETKQ